MQAKSWEALVNI